MELAENSKMKSDAAHPLLYKKARIGLSIGGVSAILASVCCLGTFLLTTLKFSNAGILYLMTLADWSRPFFILLALLSLIFSYNSIWGSRSHMRMGVCTTRKEMMANKAYFLFVVGLVVTMLMLPYFAPGIE